MKALIFNSGLGSRMGKLTENGPKCLVVLPNTETILERQIRLLAASGIDEIVITTGPFAERVEEVARRAAARYLGNEQALHIVHNPNFASTNYVYSMACAREFIGAEPLLILHGDMVFEGAFIDALLESHKSNLMAINPEAPLPEKDFKARVDGGVIAEVAVDIFGSDCVAAQPIYKLSAKSVKLWFEYVDEACAAGRLDIYAEEAARAQFSRFGLEPFSYAGRVVEEIDTPEDYERVSAAIEAADYEAQPVYVCDSGKLELYSGEVPAAQSKTTSLDELIATLGFKRPLLITSERFSKRLPELFGGALEGLPIFSNFSPNPDYAEVLDGVRMAREHEFDSIICLGGGSPIDVGKCIALYTNLQGEGKDPYFFEMDAQAPALPLLAIPTTAGSGAESTHFAVIYVDGKKHSMASAAMHPRAVVLVPELVAELPSYQRSATLLDALCQAIESAWAKKATQTSLAHAKAAMQMISQSWRAYLARESKAVSEICVAANESGRAINISTTTTAHAMAYKLTGLYGAIHGHAVACSLPHLWDRVLACADEDTFCAERLQFIDEALCGPGAKRGAGLALFTELFDALELPVLERASLDDLNELVASVDPTRLGNFPVELSQDDLRDVYEKLICELIRRAEK